MFDICQISGLKETGRLAPQFSLTFITFYKNKLGFLGQKSLTMIDVYKDTGIYIIRCSKDKSYFTL